MNEFFWGAAGLLLLCLIPVTWQFYRQIQEQRRGYQEALEQNRRSERLHRIERRYSIRSYQRRERKEREQDENGYE